MVSSPADKRPLVLVTRPHADSVGLVAALDQLDFDSLLEPMMEIHSEPFPPGSLDETLSSCQAILITSANGVRVLAEVSTDRQTPVLAVGDASAAAARALGFRQVRSAGGDVVTLVRLIEELTKDGVLVPSGGALFHPAGSAVAGDLAGAVEGLGFRFLRNRLYRAETVPAFSPICCSALQAGEVAAATFFSPRTARHFVALARDAGLAPALVSIDAFALSPAVASVLQDLPWRTVYACASPTQKNLIDQLSRTLQ